MPTSTEHDHSHTYRTNQIDRRDPTQTITLRKRYAQEARGRWDNVIRQIREAVIENDVFGMRANVETPPTSAYSFPQDSSKVDSMDNFIQQLINDEVLEPVDVDAPGAGPSEHWQYPYVRQASRKGIKDAEKWMRDAGFDVDEESVQKMFNRPIHAQTLNEMWTRQFEALKDIGDETAQQIRKELTAGFAQGQNPRKIARNMTDRVSKIGKARATTMARTEVIRTHAKSTLDRYSRAGVSEVTGRSEFLSAGDSDVCPICESLHGVQFAIKEARGMIPVHPQCLLGDSFVSPRGRITSASKRSFDGKIVVIDCPGDFKLPLTPNHPVLTRRGWVSASSLNVGDEIAGPPISEWVGLGDGKNVNGKTRAKDLFESFTSSLGVSTEEVKVSSPDFHGDGSNSEVAVIGSDLLLSGNVQSSVFEFMEKLNFSFGDISSSDTRLFSTLGPLNEFFSAALGPSDSIMGRPCVPHMLGLGSAGHHKGIGFGFTPDRDTVFGKSGFNRTPGNSEIIGDGIDAFSGSVTTDNFIRRKLSSLLLGLTTQLDISAFQSPLDGSSRDFEFVGDRGNGESISVQTNDLVYRKVESISQRHHSGYVYNFETTKGYYITNGLTTKNCRCTWVLVQRQSDVNPERFVSGR